jgi:hypothetical protein
LLFKLCIVLVYSILNLIKLCVCWVGGDRDQEVSLINDLLLFDKTKIPFFYGQYLIKYVVQNFLCVPLTKCYTFIHLVYDHI